MFSSILTLKKDAIYVTCSRLISVYEIASPSRIKRLRIGQSALADNLQGISDFTSLELLNASNTGLTSIDNRLELLKNLWMLDVSWNMLLFLPGNLKELKAVILLHGNPFQCSCALAAIVSEVHFVDGPTAATCDTFGDLVPLRKLISLTEENIQCAEESVQDIPMYIIFFSWVIGLMVTLYRYSKAESNSSEESYTKMDPNELASIRKEAIEIQNRINQNRDSEMQKIRNRRSKCPTHSNCSSCKGF